jgi:hypothetical protein
MLECPSCTATSSLISSCHLTSRDRVNLSPMKGFSRLDSPSPVARGPARMVVSSQGDAASSFCPSHKARATTPSSSAPAQPTSSAPPSRGSHFAHRDRRQQHRRLNNPDPPRYPLDLDARIVSSHHRTRRRSGKIESPRQHRYSP